MRHVIPFVCLLFLTACASTTSTRPIAASKQPVFVKGMMIGSFAMVTSKMVAVDPGWDVEDGSLIEPCREGIWHVYQFPSPSPRRLPGPIIALHCTLPADVGPESSDWTPLHKSIGGDGGIEGIYDTARFADEKAIPSGHRFGSDWSELPEKRWYGYICDIALGVGSWRAAVHPFGCSIIWDGGCSVSVLRDRDQKIMGVRLNMY